MQKIYVLQCENGKYYVGKTSNIDRRLAEHFSGNYGSEWTTFYTPHEVIEVEDMISEFDEMKKTLEYMKRYGIDHVRGAQWSNINLTSDQRASIRAAMNTDACFHCGEFGHFANDCFNRNQSSQTPQTIQCFRCRNYGHYANNCFNRNQSSQTPQTIQCFRCRNYGHYANQCLVIQCQRCGSNTHSEDTCYATFDINGDMLDCARCGRDTHCADECRARTDINGRRL